MFLLKKINKIALSSNDDERMQSIDSIEAYTYGTSKRLVSETKEIKCTSIISNTKMIKLHNVKKNIIRIRPKFLIIYTEY